VPYASFFGAALGSLALRCLSLPEKLDLALGAKPAVLISVMKRL